MVAAGRGVPHQWTECALLVRAAPDRRQHLPLPPAKGMESATKEFSVR